VRREVSAVDVATDTAAVHALLDAGRIAEAQARWDGAARKLSFDADAAPARTLAQRLCDATVREHMDGV
jgi:hypothetical protein